MLTHPLRQIKVHAMVGAALLGYLITFDGLYPALGSGIGAVGVIPVGLIGGAYGILPGLLSGVLLTLLNMFLLYTVGDARWTIFPCSAASAPRPNLPDRGAPAPSEI
jgi:hypothetical protein